MKFTNETHHHLNIKEYLIADSTNNFNQMKYTSNISSIFDPNNYPSSYKSEKAARHAVIISLYSTIVLVSLFGNLLVCYVIFKCKRMRISTNILMANLAVSDLLMTVFNIPLNIMRILLNEWPFGSIICVTVPLVQVTSV